MIMIQNIIRQDMYTIMMVMFLFSDISHVIQEETTLVEQSHTTLNILSHWYC